MIDEARQPLVLVFDSAGSGCSVAVAVGERVLGTQRVASAHGQAEALLPLIDAAMRAARVQPIELDLIATTVGPGSFTGIRVGLAAAQGIALATNAQLIGVTAFEAVAAGYTPPDRDDDRFLLVAIESRREDLYVQLYDRRRDHLGDPLAVMPGVLDEAVSRIIGAAPLLIAGDAAQRAALALSARPLTTIVEVSPPDAQGVLRAALRRWQVCKQGDTPQPFYLRPPDVTLSSGRQRASRGQP
jgi:tRNA threonylcarbamoyladenosine biosynthesis protein TsaB